MVMIGCYAPLNGETQESSLTLDLSGFIGTLDQVPEPGEDGFVIDIYLFRAADVSLPGDVFVTSRQDSIPIGGKRFERIVIGTSVSDISASPIVEQTTARISGIPTGGPYVLLVLVWNSNFPHWEPVWVSASEGQLVTFSIEPNKTTQLDGGAVTSVSAVFFDDGETHGNF
ncbi:MAG: hypothetical protein EA384_12555 [Spirochaetaceae bacterium]|nr:MAG: hypothetical protein EA384_12555 [Spirochaetaceae bacterium]